MVKEGLPLTREWMFVLNWLFSLVNGQATAGNSQITLVKDLFTRVKEPKGLKNRISAGDRQVVTLTVYLLQQYQIHTKSHFTAS
jgi:hypothetical protein